MAHRIERVNSLIRREISELLQRQVKDPRLGSFITINEVITSPDLKQARVFVSWIGSEEEKRQTLNILASASGFFRRELAGRLKLRRIPELSFHWDDSMDRGHRLFHLIEQLASGEEG
ncbi:30S ribosome-binding factor RbfA [Chloroflexota bacterium]